MVVNYVSRCELLKCKLPVLPFFLNDLVNRAINFLCSDVGYDLALLDGDEGALSDGILNYIRVSCENNVRAHFR